MSRSIFRFSMFGILLILISLVTMGAQCDGSSNEEKGIQKQAELMDQATNQAPVPEINNFLTRKKVAKWMRRMDEPNKEFYNYIFASNGQLLRHFVTNGRPISVGTFMTPTKKEYHVNGQGANPLGPAPALDGTYYGSGGSAGAARFAFDAATDAYFEVVDLGAFLMIVCDQPLDIESEKLTIKTE